MDSNSNNYNYNYNYRNIIVTTPSKTIRKIARESLSGKWKLAAMGTFIFMAVVLVPSYFIEAIVPGSSVADIYIILVAGAFTMGYSAFILNILRNKEANYSDLFQGFEMLLKTMGLYLYICLFILLWSLLFVIPGIFAALRYSQAFFILADNPDMPITEIVNESKRMMKGNKGKYFCLSLSFIGWIWLAAIPSAIFSSVFAEMYSDVIVSAGSITAVGTGFGLLYELIVFILNAGTFFVTAYAECALAALYDIMNGKLRIASVSTPGAPSGSPYIIDVPGSADPYGMSNPGGENKNENNVNNSVYTDDYKN